MSRKLLTTLFLIVALSSAWVVSSLYHKDDIRRDFNGPLWLFNFGPEKAPDFLNFKKVTGKDIYNPSTGFGWQNLEGNLREGKWTATSLYWEGAENFNAIMRPGPDDLSSSYITGPATFILDVEPGKYDVWILTGDTGLREYVPYQSYRIEVNGVEAYRFDTNEEMFYKMLDTPSDDILNQDDIYEHYIEPYFKWKKTTVNVPDGKLKVRVVSKMRDHLLLGLLGDYPLSEQRSGPLPRFGGALNAMIVARSGANTKHLVEQVDVMRKHNFLSRFPRKRIPRDKSELKPEDLRRGYSIFIPDIGDVVLPTTVKQQEKGPLKAIASLGEFIPLTFALAAQQDLGKTNILFQSLKGPNGAQINSTDITIGKVRYIADPVRYWEKVPWQPVPGPIIPIKDLIINTNTTKQFWVTVHIPKNSEPGNYTGNIQITPATGESIKIPVMLRVLPFALKRPSYLSVGLTYFVPIMDAYFGKERFWNRIRQEFADMRRHNLTTVQLTGMGLENYEGLDKLFSAYEEAGFEQPVYFLESAAKIIAAYKGHNFTVNSKKFNDFCDSYVHTIHNFLAEKGKRGWPDIIIDFGDEFTNSAKEEVGAAIAKRLEKIPGIVTGADVNGDKELRVLAPHVSILSFNEGWVGPTKVNQGKRQLVHAGTVRDILSVGATPWLVNIGKDRFSNGYYFWKMSRLGLKGKIEWIYRDYRAMPHNPFAGQGSHANIMDRAIYPGPDNTILTTIPYERMRQGLDDLAYLYTLEYLTKKTSSSQIRNEAEALLERIDQMISDDYSKYRDAKQIGNRWNNDRYYELRSEISRIIIRLKHYSNDQTTSVPDIGSPRFSHISRQQSRLSWRAKSGSGYRVSHTGHASD